MNPEHWNITLVDSLAECERFLDWIDELPGVVAIDTETTGLKWWTRNFTRLVQFASGEQAWAVPVEWWGMVVRQAMAAIRERGLPVVFHNAKFDMHALEADGFPVPAWDVVHDTKIQHHLLWPHENHSLKPLSARLFGEWARAGQSDLRQAMNAHGWEWDTIPVNAEEYWVYGGLDTLLTWYVHQLLMPQVAEKYPAQYELEMTVQAIMYRAESRGIRVDPTYASALRRQWQSEAVTLGRELEVAGVPNPRSNKQLEAFLRDIGWTPEEFTPTGAAKMDKHVLTLLSAEWPEAAKIMRFKRITKWTTVYLDRFIDDRDANNRVHPGINTLQARTGRMSITEPPLQTLPSKGSGGEIRRCVIPDPHHDLWSIDYQAQEARLFASYSGDRAMLDCIARGDDLYSFTASQIYGRPVTKADPIRDTTKVTMLAFLYGAGTATLSKQTGMPPDQVEAFLSRLFEVFPGVRELTGDHAIGGNYPGGPAITAMQKLQTEGLAYIHTGGGRRFSVPGPDELYKAVNGLLQGTAADVLKSAIIRVHAAGLSDYIVLPVHDELLYQFPSDTGRDMAAAAAEAMTDHDWTAPLTVDTTGPLTSWGEAYA